MGGRGRWARTETRDTEFGALPQVSVRLTSRRWSIGRARRVCARVICIAGILTPVVVAAVSASDEVQVARFANLRAAHAGNVISEGWLPDWLPSSTRDIQLRRDREAQIASGRLTVSPDDMIVLEVNLKVCAEWFEPPKEIRTELGNTRARNEGVYQYDDAGLVWLFACRSDGSCRFWRWRQKTDA